MKAHVEWLTAGDAARHLGFVNPDGTAALNAFYKARRVLGIRTHWLGGRMRFRAVDLDRAVQAETTPLRAVGGRS